jgi:hypothetical protein
MQQNFIFRKVSFLPLFSMMLALAACSGSKSSGGGDASPVTQNEVTRPNVIVHTPVDHPLSSIRPGMYTATLTTLNKNVAGAINGTATFNINKKDFSVEVDILNSTPHTIHGQYLQMASDCPKIEADMNHDGFVDFKEALPSVGEIIIPLDGDISSQMLDSYIFPASDDTGAYVYMQTAGVNQMIEDLTLPDENTDDDIVKIKKGDVLDIEGKVVVVYGVPATTVLPETVATMGNFPAYASLPVACGKIIKK